MSKPIRVATICHNEDDHKTPNHRRVRLELHKTNGEYRWFNDAGQECGIADAQTVYDAEINAIQAWGADIWDFQAKWWRK